MCLVQMVLGCLLSLPLGILAAPWHRLQPLRLLAYLLLLHGHGLHIGML